MPKLLRKGGGQPIRDAMKRAGLTGPALAAATRKIDPASRGVSTSTIGRLTGTGRSARDRCELGTAWLIAEALHLRTNAPLQELFGIPTDSTLTIER